MSNYYFLASSLPELRIGEPPDLSFEELDYLLRDNLKPEDFEKAARIRFYYDLQNIRFFWLEEPLSPYGNFNPVELEEALQTGIGLADYLVRYLEEHQGEQEALASFPRLISLYFRKEAEASKGFARSYLVFEREWRLVLAGFRAKLIGRDLFKEMQFEDPDDDLVSQIIAQKDAKSYEPPFRYEELKPLFEAHAESPIDLYQALCAWRFRKIEEMLGVDMMSIDRILGYMAQLILVERWVELDRERGKELLNRKMGTV